MSAPKFGGLFIVTLITASVSAGWARPVSLSDLVRETDQFQSISLAYVDTMPDREFSRVLNQAALVHGVYDRFAQTEEGRALRPYLDSKFPNAAALANTGNYAEVATMMHSTLNLIAGRPQRVDVAITSTPSDAHADVLFWDGGIAKPVTTDGVAQRLAIGLYTVRVTKEGYLAVDEALDLVTEDVATINCTLLTADGSAGQGRSVCHKVR